MSEGITELHQIALAAWYSSRRGSDVLFIATIDKIERILTPAQFKAYCREFPNLNLEKCRDDR